MPTTRTYSDFLHIPIALGLMVIALLLSRWSIVAASAFCGVFACFYREVTQEEYRWIAANGGLRATMPRFQGLYVCSGTSTACWRRCMPGWRAPCSRSR